MLVIVSDLHLKDGTTGSAITPDAFRVFAEKLRSTTYRASWRADDRYDPIKTIDLLLLGDIFDLIRSERWLTKQTGEPENIRPWDDPHSQAYIEKIHEITRKSPNGLNFVGINVMTYLAFFEGGERRGRQFEAWSGSLSKT